MSKWLAFINGIIVGPFEQEQVVKMFKDGSLNVNDKISREGELFWKTVFEFPEFKSLEVSQDSVVSVTAADQTRVKKNLRTCFFNKKAEDSLPTIPNAANQRLKNNEIHFTCPHCQRKYLLDLQDFKGQKVDCPSCNKQFTLYADSNLMPQYKAPEPAAFPAINEVDFSEEVPDGDINCPHCWKSFSKESVCYISTHPDLLGDNIAGEFEQKRFVPTVYHSNGLPLDAKGMPCTDMACPHCHLRLPASIVDLSSFYVSIAGAPASGKSYFLTSLVHNLRRNLPENNFSFYDVDPIINSVLNNYEDTLFMAVNSEKVVSLPKTQQIGSDFSNQIFKNNIAFELPKPFIFRLQSTNPSQRQNSVNRNIVFYDNAGEHFQPGADSIANPATIHLAHSDGIIFLFDPIGDANMRKGCDKCDPQLENTKVSDQTTLFAEMVNRIRRHGNMTSGETSDIPLIIAVGKYDTWKHKLPKEVEKMSFFSENSEDFTPELNMNAVMDVSFALRELMQEAAPALVAQSEAFFRKVIFVPVSSFGCPACKGEDGSIGIIPSKLNPVLVDLPVKLLLAEKGLIPKKAPERSGMNSNLVCKIIDSHIVFKHPVNDKRVCLPAIYADCEIEINGTKYRLPHVSSAGNTAGAEKTTERKVSVWE